MNIEKYDVSLYVGSITSSIIVSSNKLFCCVYSKTMNQKIDLIITDYQKFYYLKHLLKAVLVQNIVQFFLTLSQVRCLNLHISLFCPCHLANQICVRTIVLS